VVFCEHGNEILDSVKCGEFIQQLTLSTMKLVRYKERLTNAKMKHLCQSREDKINGGLRNADKNKTET
jgi:hypothetical protein